MILSSRPARGGRNVGCGLAIAFAALPGCSSSAGPESDGHADAASPEPATDATAPPDAKAADANRGPIEGGAITDATTGPGVPDDGGRIVADAGAIADAGLPVDAGHPLDASRGPAADASASDGASPYDPALLADCTGTSPIVCAVPVPNGNYDVSVDLGGAAAATTRVQAETWRLEQQPVTTGPGSFSSATFTVNVRAEQHGTYSAPGGILNLLFDGTAPALHGLAVTPAPGDVTVFVAGDSTVCDWDPSASNAITPPTPSIERGWAQELSLFLQPGVAVANYAVSGQTAGSFYGAYFPPARTAMKAGDYLFVQFGHNDQKSAADIAAYTANLTKYITDARAKKATPVIFTPVARGTGTDFAGLDQEARDLAAAQGVTLVDLTNLAWAYYQTLPDPKVLFVPGQETHFTEAGATQIAQIVATALKSSGLPLAASVR